MCHVALLVRGSNKVQQDSPVHLGKAVPDLPEGQVLLSPSRQLVSEESQLSGLVRANMLEMDISGILRRADETCSHARLLHEYQGSPF